ncbi:Putative teichuronic acid biosynthesis glycosyltransferase TuaC [Gimesia panareensis]|uniref:Teichuronic acid biosynthesis glycosyltransferase TuaC n=1 Tax=Gimesia panareensis TaxID=2527978 RepID=A0A517Q590_9PLAN|nr:glycosyltransferase family 4 protein [Gimesia panareensis]QDT26791.1 Putative teichuronic acid biosynthesis glycosyltransferase TuaC [Gimesia panareensis]
MIKKNTRHVIGILTTEDAHLTDQRLKSVLHNYPRPILFKRPGDPLSEFAQQFETIEVADEAAANQVVQERFKGAIPFLEQTVPDPEPDADPVPEVKPTPIRVGFILHGLAFGGISRVILNMLEAPVNHGLEWAGIAIHSLNHLDQDVTEKISRYCPVYSVQESEHTLQAENPYQAVIDRADVIYMTGIVDRIPLLDFTEFDGKPVILSAHGQCEFSRSQIETISQYGGQKIYLAVSQSAVQSYPAPLRDQVRVIYNGINYSRCAPLLDRKAVRASWGIDEDTKAVGYLGRLAYDKRPMAAAEAVQELGEGYHAVYIGNGYAEDNLRPQIRQLCGDRCTILDKTEDLGSQLAALDCLVLASPLEGGPMIVAEAWLAGCPVVSTPVGMIPELEAQHGKLTYQLPQNYSLDHLVNQVRAATSGHSQITEWAHEVAWQTFNPSRMVVDFERAIRDGILKTVPRDDRVRVGFAIGSCSMGGVSRGIITLLDQGCPGLQWSGVAIEGPGHFDPETARLILKHCPIYAGQDHPNYQGLVTIVPNQYQQLVDRSDVVKLWGTIQTRPELDQVDWDRVTVITAAHGQCEWTRLNIDVSLKYGKRHLLMSVSEGGRKCFPEDLRDQVNVIYNGLDFKRCMAQRSRHELREAWNVDEETALVAYLGRFELGGKNPLAAAQAVDQLGEKYHAVYAGEGVNQDEVIAGVKELCGGRCTFLPRTEDVGSILAAVDCIVLASPSEGCPQIMMEAFAAQCPVVSTRVGFLPELEPEYGKLTYEVPFDPSPADLAAAVKRAVLDKDDLTGKACAVALQKFNPRRYARDFEDMIRNGTVVTL